MKDKLITLLVASMVVSCSDKGLEHYVLDLNQDFNRTNYKIIGEFKDNSETGEFVIYRNGDIESKGSYSGGFKIGSWEYSGSDKNIINWKLVTHDDEFKVNIPATWRETQDAEHFSFFIPTNSSNPSQTHFSLFKINKELIKGAKEYHGYNLNHMLNKYNYPRVYLGNYEQGNITGYYYDFEFIESNEKRRHLSFCFDYEDYIYSFFISSLSDELRKFPTLFSDIISTARIDNERIFNPSVEYSFTRKKVTKINKVP